jgi:hypothetical protein
LTLATLIGGITATGSMATWKISWNAVLLFGFAVLRFAPLSSLE